MPRPKMNEKRCSNCGKLLFKGDIQVKDGKGKIEVKCVCGTLNTFEIDLNGQLSFQDRIFVNRKNLITRNRLGDY
jgi:phage FluMu protein Com